MNLRNHSSEVEISGEIYIGDCTYRDMTIQLGTQEADPSLGQPAHIDECFLIRGICELSDGTEVKIEGEPVFKTETMTKQFESDLADLAWEYLEEDV